MKITATTWGHLPEAMPEGVRAEFLAAFKPLPTEPRTPDEANGSIHTEQAHDVRPIAKLLNGVWKNKDGHIDVHLTFPERDTDEVKWTIDFKRQVGVSIVNASLSRIDSPGKNAVRMLRSGSTTPSRNSSPGCCM